MDGWYARLRDVAANPINTNGLAAVHYCAQNNFTLQYPVLLAPLRRDDDEQTCNRKLRVVSAFLDILIARRIWNRRATNYSAMQYAMFLIVRDIRGKDTPALVKILEQRLDKEETFIDKDRFGLQGNNRRQIHQLLARMTDYLETQSGRQSRYREYMQGGNEGYEVEHIWANHPERHTHEFEHPSDFTEYRNRIGGLLLLPKKFNAAFGDLTYAKKRNEYLKQNLLAQSLHEGAYKLDPGFSKFIRISKLPFKAHTDFHKRDLDERQDLYRHLAEQIWNPCRLTDEAKS